jgi:cytidyltransferase-like protein
MKNGPKITGVFLGRFAPFHKGHIKVVRKIIKLHGLKNILILIGSSKSLSIRTPYTFEQRKIMIQTVFPTVKIIPLPDTTEREKHVNDPANNEWFKNISEIEKGMGTKFIFYGGSIKDLEILSLKFKTSVIFDRKTEGMGISATKIREAVCMSDLKTVRSLVNSKIYKLMVPALTNYDASMHHNF